MPINKCVVAVSIAEFLACRYISSSSRSLVKCLYSVCGSIGGVLCANPKTKVTWGGSDPWGSREACMMEIAGESEIIEEQFTCCAIFLPELWEHECPSSSPASLAMSGPATLVLGPSAVSASSLIGSSQSTAERWAVSLRRRLISVFAPSSTPAQEEILVHTVQILGCVYQADYAAADKLEIT